MDDSENQYLFVAKAVEKQMLGKARYRGSPDATEFFGLE